tara:strand:+ start:1039 stop:1212 length:174 start_codon:yes stop_codon:yes gene_type:complete
MVDIYRKIDDLIDMNNKNFNTNWETPEITELGNAKDIVKNVNVTGGGDTEFSVLLPS